MKALQIILFTLITLTGCAKKADPAVTKMNNDTTQTATPSSGLLTYLALGDSYTVGEAEPYNECFPAQLTALLNTAKFGFAPPTIIATTGWTTANLIYAIANSGITQKKYDFVTLLIGVNDQFQGVPQSTYNTNFVQLLHTAINFVNGDSTRVFVLSIPDYGVTPFAAGRDSIIGPEIDEFNAINKIESIQAGVNYLDITAISREAATDPTLIAPDGLHPSGKMYTLWVQQLYPMIAARLKK